MRFSIMCLVIAVVALAAPTRAGMLDWLRDGAFASDDMTASDLEALEARADDGDARAHLVLGHLHGEGRLVARNWSRAYEHYTTAAALAGARSLADERAHAERQARRMVDLLPKEEVVAAQSRATRRIESIRLRHELADTLRQARDWATGVAVHAGRALDALTEPSEGK
ncbi:MAG: hypothetical protein HQL40_04820 [Alphaproteobacteria bacterium]|nr:hypothetical protein [Alphaproteobacteria bacterium]